MQARNLISILALAALCTFGCLAVKARENALLPAMRTAWVGVRGNIELGIQDAHLDDPSAPLAAVGALDSALTAGDELRLSVAPWELLEPYGQRGIDSKLTRGDVTEPVATSLRERLRQFGRALSKFKVGS